MLSGALAILAVVAATTVATTAAGVDGSPETAAPSRPSTPVEPGTAAAELVRIRRAHRLLDPSVRRASRIAREVEARYRSTDRELAVREVGTMLAVESLVLIHGGATRRVPTENGIYFALCGGQARPQCRLGPSDSTRAARPRQQALELAARIFVETPVALVVASLPQSATRSVLLVFERKALLAEVDVRRALHHLTVAGRAAAAFDRTIDRLTDGRLFAPAGLVAVSETRDALVAHRLPVPEARGDPGATASPPDLSR